MDRENGAIHGRAGVAGRRERRIERPAAAKAPARAAVDEHRDQQHHPGGDQQPERDVVHPREGHVRRADHQRYEPVAEPADHGGHDHEEDHDQGVTGDHHVVTMLGRLNEARRCEPGAFPEHLNPGFKEFPTDQAGQGPAHEARHDGEQDVEGANVLVVRGIEPAGEEPRRVVAVFVFLSVCGGLCHLRVLKLTSRPAPRAQACRQGCHRPWVRVLQRQRSQRRAWRPRQRREPPRPERALRRRRSRPF